MKETGARTDKVLEETKIRTAAVKTLISEEQAQVRRAQSQLTRTFACLFSFRWREPKLWIQHCGRGSSRAVYPAGSLRNRSGYKDDETRLLSLSCLNQRECQSFQ